MPIAYLPCTEEFVDHQKSFLQTQAYSNLMCNRFRKEYLPNPNNRLKKRSTANETFKKGDHVWLIKDKIISRYYNLCRVTELDDGSDGVIRSAMVQTNDGVYKRPVGKLAPVLPEKDVLAMENRVGDMAAELTNSINEYYFNSASRPFQSLKLE